MVPIVTAKAFIEQILIPLREGWGYIYGYAGVTWTAELQDKIERTTDANRAASRQYGSQWIGRKVTDCSGLIRWALRQLGSDIIHQARYQYTDQSARKGKLVDGRREDGQPILPGTCVFLQGNQERIHHVGVYVGGGICVEAKGARYGVVTSKLDHWDHWGELKMVDYTDAEKIEEEPAPEIPDREEKRDVLYHAVVNNPGKWLNVRSGPSTSYSTLFRLEKGDAVDVLAEDNGWDQVRFGSRVGWASAEYLQRTDEQPPEDPPETDEGDKAEEDELRQSVMDELLEIRRKLDNVIRRMGGTL